MLTAEEYERLQIALKALGPHIGSMSDWRKNFFEDMVKRTSQYGQRTFVSEKQWDVIHDVYEEIEGDELP